MEKEKISFPVYKGLKKPFVFKGFKGKWIYYVAGSLISSIVIGAILSTWSGLLGIGFMVVGIFGSISGGSFLQRKYGLFNKRRDHNVMWVHKGNRRLEKGKR